MKTYHVPLKSYPETLKPRERLKSLGAPALSDAELLAILLGTGHQNSTALDLAKELLLLNPKANFNGLKQLSLPGLCKHKGMGLAKAARIFAALEIGERAQQESLPLKLSLNRPDLVYQWLAPRFAHLKQEHFIVLLLDSKQKLCAQKVVHIGTLNQAIVHPRDVFREAVSHSAQAIVLAHNHPSGDPSPSPEDLQLTQHLIECGQMMQIEIQDHVIIGQDGYYSVREHHPYWGKYAS